MNIEILSSRRWGEPKLTTPKELKGIKKEGSIPFGTKCACPVYFTPTHIYIKHRDWFSPSISFPEAKAAGIIDNIRMKFVYNDNFGSVVLRSEAWLRMPLLLLTRWHGLLPAYGLTLEMERTCELPEGTLCVYDWTHFFEELLKLAKPYLPHKRKLETYSSLLEFHTPRTDLPDTDKQ